MKDLKTTNTLLLLIVIPVVFYVLKIMSFIFIPLFFSMFIALLFLPLTRWLQKKKVPRILGIGIVFVLVVGIVRIILLLISLSSREVVANRSVFLEKAKIKLDTLLLNTETVLGLKIQDSSEIMAKLMENGELMNKFGPTMDFLGGALSTILMTAFFVILWLAESINLQQIIKGMLDNQKFTSVRTFMEIEQDLITFVKVKFMVSLLVGVGTGLICYFFGVSFAFFWGLFAFAANFVQMIGPIAQIVLLALFGMVELDISTTLLFFIISIVAIHTIVGSVLEPIFMGKSFSINVITILIMLMLWGYICGIPGMIMAIPMTVFMKIIFEQFPGTQGISILMSGNKDIDAEIENKRRFKERE